MKPTVINCGTGCRWCDGYGIMTLQPMGIVAPCIICSPDDHLNDLEERKRKALLAFELSKEKEMIRKHNERLP